jgi:ABC-type transporter Mla MlaB component
LSFAWVPKVLLRKLGHASISCLSSWGEALSQAASCSRVARVQSSGVALLRDELWGCSL